MIGLELAISSVRISTPLEYAFTYSIDDKCKFIHQFSNIWGTKGELIPPPPLPHNKGRDALYDSVGLQLDPKCDFKQNVNLEMLCSLKKLIGIVIFIYSFCAFKIYGSNIKTFYISAMILDMLTILYRPVSADLYVNINPMF